MGFLGMDFVCFLGEISFDFAEIDENFKWFMLMMRLKAFKDVFPSKFRSLKLKLFQSSFSAIRKYHFCFHCLFPISQSHFFY